MSRVYGVSAVAELIDAAPEAIVCVIVDAAGGREDVDALVERARALGLAVRQEGDSARRRRAGGRGGATIGAEVRPRAPIELDAIVADGGPSPLVIALDRVTDPHNLGAIVRTAAAFRATAVVVPRDHAAPLNDAAVRASAGAVAHVPVVRVTNLSRALRQLRDQGLWTVATEPDARETLWSFDMTLPLVAVLGAEGPGLRRGVRKACQTAVAIPMSGPVQSLNVSVMAGVLIAEAARQRHAG